MTLPRTASQTVGPYYTLGLCRRSENELADREEAGAFQLVGELIDGQGMPINDGLIEILDAAGGRWGRSTTDADGRFTFIVTKPEALPGQAPRFDMFVFARGLLRHQLTRVYFPDEPEANGGDPVFSALDKDDRATLLAEQEDGALRFDVHLQGERATVFFEH